MIMGTPQKEVLIKKTPVTVRIGRQRGFSLVEILVSIVVLSIGLLGLAALQTSSFRFNQESHLRSVATAQLTAMADRMRANRAGVTLGAYDNMSGIPVPPPCTTCAPSNSAIRDQFEWNTENAVLFPVGQGTVNNNAGVHTISIMWDEQRTGATGTNCGGNPTVDLTCLQMSLMI